MRVFALLTVVLATMLAGGCSAGSLGRPLGGVGYVLDHKPDRQPISWIWTEADLPELTELIAQLGDGELQQRLADVDLTREVVVSLYYDACSTQDPELVLDGAQLVVRLRTDLHRNCVRAVDTLALFAVPRAELPNPVSYAGQEFTLG